MSQTRAQLVKGFTNTSAPADVILVDSNGNVGINATPEAWSGFDALEVNEASIVSSGSGDAFFTANAYYDGAWKYKDAGVARNIYMNSDGIVFRTAPSGSADGAISWTEVGRWREGGGLCFNGDTAAANGLDDYEEGTWTPTVTSGASSLTVTTASCMYTKVGKLVTLQFEIRDPTSVTSDAFKLGGLPFNFDDQTVGSVMVHSVNFDTGRTMVTLYGYSSELRFYGSGDSVAWEILHGNDITTSGIILGTISYRVA